MMTGSGHFRHYQKAWSNSEMHLKRDPALLNISSLAAVQRLSYISKGEPEASVHTIIKTTKNYLQCTR
jgi:hypothetical protein